MAGLDLWLKRAQQEGQVGSYTAEIKTEMDKFMNNTVAPKVTAMVTADMNNPNLAEGTDVKYVANLRLAGSIDTATGTPTYLQGSGYDMNNDESISYMIGGQVDSAKTQQIKSLIMNGWNAILRKYSGAAKQNKVPRFAFEYTKTQQIG